MDTLIVHHIAPGLPGENFAVALTRRKLSTGTPANNRNTPSRPASVPCETPAAGSWFGSLLVVAGRSLFLGDVHVTQRFTGSLDHGVVQVDLLVRVDRRDLAVELVAKLNLSILVGDLRLQLS